MRFKRTSILGRQAAGLTAPAPAPARPSALPPLAGHGRYPYLFLRDSGRLQNTGPVQPAVPKGHGTGRGSGGHGKGPPRRSDFFWGGVVKIKSTISYM